MTDVHAAPQVLRGIQQVIAAFAENGIGKNRKNEQQGFSFRGIDDVMNRMAKHLNDASLVVAPNIRSREVYERTNSRGNPLFYVTVQVDYTVYSTLDGSSIVCSVPGEAMDSGDKATNKALSIAYKYLCFQLFAIPTDEDPDATTHQVAPKAQPSGFIESAPAENTISEAEVAIIQELATQADVKEQMLLATYKIGALNQLPKSKLQEVSTRLQTKIRNKTKSATA